MTLADLHALYRALGEAIAGDDFTPTALVSLRAARAHVAGVLRDHGVEL